MGAATNEGNDTYQRFPDSSPLISNLNMDPIDLIRRIRMIGGRVYCYVLTSVKYVDGRFVQTGSGPNFQGGLITLCTCKRLMRTGKVLGAWSGTWIAGITGVQTGHAGNGHLFYLMRVERAFESHLDLWSWLSAHLPKTAEAKAADKHRLGDIYRPKTPRSDPFAPATYVTPCPDHDHAETEWYKDIYYEGYGHRTPALLVGDPRNSFLWSEPRMPVPIRLGRGYKIIDLDELLPHLDEASVL